MLCLNTAKYTSNVGAIMKMSRFFAPILMSILLITTITCKDESKEVKHESESAIVSEGEESVLHLTNAETYDAVRNGVRLILAYDETSSTFIGTAQNVTDQPISAVHVEVHLSNGTELGPTPRIKLTSGQMESVRLSAEGQSFNWWKAHAESNEGAREHSGEHADEHEEEHGSDQIEEH
jgi:hypothetical protein